MIGRRGHHFESFVFLLGKVFASLGHLTLLNRLHDVVLDHDTLL